MSTQFKLTKDYEFCRGYEYQLFKFGHEEIIVISDKYQQNLQCYKLANYSIKQALQAYNTYILTLKK